MMKRLKRPTIIRLSIGLWLLSLIAIYFGVDAYVKAKDGRLYIEIRDKISDVFKNKTFIDVVYSGYEVKYAPVKIPLSPKKRLKLSPIEKDLEKELLSIYKYNPQKEWDEKYKDLTKLYQINPKLKALCQPWAGDGWNLITLKYDDEGIYLTWLYPYAVGYRKQEYMPSIQSAVNAAFEFFTKNEKSDYINDFEKGSFNRIMSAVHDCDNEYYGMAQDKTRRFLRVGKPLFEKYGKDPENGNYPYQATYMYNGYYKVFIAETQPTTYSIQKWNWKPDVQDKNKLLLWWEIGFTLLMLGVVVPLSIKEHRKKKERNETLYQRMLRLCNPERFMKDYSKDKLDKANRIYQSLLSLTADSDTEKIQELRNIAEEELDLNFVSVYEVKELKEQANPQNFMHPYNAEKIAKANELYSLLSKGKLTYNEFEEIKSKIQEL